MWSALLEAGLCDEESRTLHLQHADVRLHRRSTGVGVRGRARWMGVPYRVTAHLLPVGASTRLVITGREDARAVALSALLRRRARRLASRDLRRLARATCVQSARTAVLVRD